MLAISLSSTVLPAFSTIINDKNSLQSITHVPVPFLGKNYHLGVSNFYTKTVPTQFNVLPKTSDYSSLSTNLTEPEKERSIPQVEQDDEDQHEITIQLPAAEYQIADFWREIHGQNDWVDLLDPMDGRLRSELIRYGEMAQACYDAFDDNPFSKYCGTSKYTPSEFFDSLGMSQLGYDVSCYLFATSNINLPNFFRKSASPKVWSKHANWIGYIAVSNDETSRRLGRRDITIAWRGTVTQLEWIEDIKDFLVPISSKIPCPDTTVKVQTGFLDLYTEKYEDCNYCRLSAREQILSEVRRLLDMYADEEVSITITGHSLGAALAFLSAYDIVQTSLKELAADRPVVPVCVFTFAGPRVGNVMFRERLESTLGLKVLRVVNVHDVVPKVPGLLFNERSPPVMMKFAKWLPWSYSHVGVEIALDHWNSPFLKRAVHDDPVRAHNLEAHLHLLDGYHGKDHKFELACGRDIALVNKASDFLEDEYLVPPHWRQDENKGMVRNKDGHWVQPERRVHDHYCHGTPDDDHVKCLDLASDDQYGDAAAAAAAAAA